MDVWNLKGGLLRIISQNEIEEIHQRALDVLQQVGCFLITRSSVPFCQTRCYG